MGQGSIFNREAPRQGIQRREGGRVWEFSEPYTADSFGHLPTRLATSQT